LKKVIKLGAKVIHELVDLLAEEIAGKPLKEKKKKDGTNKKDHRGSNGSGNIAH